MFQQHDCFAFEIISFHSHVLKAEFCGRTLRRHTLICLSLAPTFNAALRCTVQHVYSPVRYVLQRGAAARRYILGRLSFSVKLRTQIRKVMTGLKSEPDLTSGHLPPVTRTGTAAAEWKSAEEDERLRYRRLTPKRVHNEHLDKPVCSCAAMSSRTDWLLTRDHVTPSNYSLKFFG